MKFTPEDYRRAARKVVTAIEMGAGVSVSSPEGLERLRAMLDAAAEVAQEKTCALCVHWRPANSRGDRGCQNNSMLAICLSGHDAEFLPPPDFGCTLWTPRETP